MPSTGTPSSYTAGSIVGAPSTWTLFGPPLKMIPLGSRAATSAAVIEWETISEWTFASRTRRAISWAYWAPKSTTRTVSCSIRPSAVGDEEDDRHHEQRQEDDGDHGAHDGPQRHALRAHAPRPPRRLAVAVLWRTPDHARRHESGDTALSAPSPH